MSNTPILTLTPERAAVLKGIDTQVDVLLQVRAPSAPPSFSRSTLNLAVVLDRSGSMNGEPLAVAKQCALFVQSRLTSQDVISLVTYDDIVNIAAASSAASPNDHFQNAVQQIVSGGTTNLFGGWEAGVAEVKKRVSEHPINRVLLLSDGCLNHGVIDGSTIRQACLDAAQQGIKTSTYGLGKHFDESIMCMMAEVSGGNNRYGEQVEDLLEGFIEELDLLAHLYTPELTLSLMPAAGVEVECLNSFVKIEDTWALPDLAYDAEVWVGLRLRVSVAAAEAQQPLLKVQVNAQVAGQSIESSHDLAALPAVSPTVFESVAPASVVTKYIAELKIAELKLEASQAGQRGEWEQVEALIKKIRALPMTDIQKSEIDELEALFKNRQKEIFAKEARFSSSLSQRSMKSGAMSYLTSSDWTNSDHSSSAPPSYMRRKSRQGRASANQSDSSPRKPSKPPQQYQAQFTPPPKVPLKNQTSWPKKLSK